MRMHGLVDYFTVPKNYLDFIGLLCYILFAAGELSQWDEDKDHVKNNWDLLFIPSLFMTLLRGTMTFFNLFDQTRYLIQMTVTNLTDLTPFIIILFGQLLVFAVIFIQLDKDGESFMSGEYTALEF